MSKTDGEYELVLGNRQLLSAFFIIVILFGVFFTMGYVVGRNSGPASASSGSATTTAANQRPEAASPPSAPPPQSMAPVEEAQPPARVETKSTPPPERNESPRITPPRVAAPQVHESAPPPAKAAPASSAGVPAITPGPGRMYLQVAAAAQPQAGVVVDTLKQKGFPAILAQGPNATLFRVVVGPFADTAALGKAKADLENAGFRPMVRK